MKRFIGCGTGRCGTRSLARLINKQNKWHCTHEMKPVLPWRVNKDKLNDRIIYFRQHSHIGDIGFYYLPYLEDIIEEFPEIKVIALKRDVEETVESFMRKIPDKNHWVNDRNRWRDDPVWDKCFPNMGLEAFFEGEKLKRESIKEYWIYYYEQIEWLSDGYPNNLKLYPIEVLNDRGLQKEMFDFIGIEDPNFQVGLKRNASE